MDSSSGRRSDRISVAVMLEASGTDAENHPFTETAKTIVVNQHGALITLNRALSPAQTISLRRKLLDGTHRQAQVRVVGRVKEEPAGWAYGVAFIEANADFWNIEFPAAAESAEAVVRLLVECSHCRSQELAYLDARELKEFEAHRLFARHCRKCKAPTLWEQPQQSGSRAAGGAAPRRVTLESQLPALAVEREVPRYDTRLTACVRQSGSADEMAVCENVSPQGVCFRSRKKFEEGSKIEVAVPFTHGTANVFVPARIVHAKPLPAAGLFRHGAKYLHKD